MNEPNLQPWQIFHIALKAFGPKIISACFGNKASKYSRSGYDWAQDPTYTTKRCRNPLEMTHDFFSRLVAAGYGYVVRSAIRYLETTLEPDLKIPSPKGLLSTVEKEMLADYPALNAYHQAIKDDCQIEKIKACEQEAVDEIRRTTIKVEQERGEQ
ncbi:hypothetical protein [Desulforhopalus singaporensis]|uniref:Uncharacterized protein n=1 Tax=Desulforhopalus singaporensis TaxID=91360 RepID=A0A1H0VX33_9BACT|nr:hypothetical protein [Desulforhopalus singaporensis]SDP82758.1 hypothetical protein SAMN05660330_04282 [Desulforhopalus singaporensis]